jgi:Uma2 family endonuclease
VVSTGAARPGPDRLSPGRRARVTVAEYHRQIDAGRLGEDDRVELLEGEIVEMSPQDKPHAWALARLNRILTRAVGDAYVVRPQLPLTFSDSEPEPDLAVVRAEDEAGATRHPATALLVVDPGSGTYRDIRTAGIDASLTAVAFPGPQIVVRTLFD